MVVFENVKAEPKYVIAKTAVWWDMDTCPVPDGYDACRVRPSIESALKGLGYCGPVTITAIGNLEKTSVNVLRGLSSTGIVVQHTNSNLVSTLIVDEVAKFKDHNPPPATIMLISDKVESELSFGICRSQQARSGYNLFLAYSFSIKKSVLYNKLYTKAEWFWKSLLGAVEQETRRRLVLRKCSESGESASFLCTSCRFTALRAADFTTHLSAGEHKNREIDLIQSRLPVPGDEQSKAKVMAAPEYVKAKTGVFWDMDTCPVPGGYDARWVRPSIERALKDLGYYGPVTITATGNVEQTPVDVLRKLSSTGIVVQHAVSSMVGPTILFDIGDFKDLNPSPATIVVISDKVEPDLSYGLCHCQQLMGGYDLLWAYSYTGTEMSVVYTKAEWLWKSLLGADEQGTRSRHVVEKCSELGESASFICTSCEFTDLRVAKFTAHLSTDEHKNREIDIIQSRLPDPGDEQSKAKVKSKRLRRISFRTKHLLRLTKRRRSRRGT